MIWKIIRVIIAAATIVAVAEISKRYPRYGGLLLSLPLISVLAFTFSWYQYHDLIAISKLAKETLVLVLLGLPFFLPLVFAGQLGIGFWTAMGWDCFWHRLRSSLGSYSRRRIRAWI
jgi:hypothetical protein